MEILRPGPELLTFSIFKKTLKMWENFQLFGKLPKMSKN